MSVMGEIKSRRSRLGITQKALAARLGCPKSQVVAWENGATYPDAEQLVAISDALGTTPQAIAGAEYDSMQETIATDMKDLKTTAVAVGVCCGLMLSVWPAARGAWGEGVGLLVLGLCLVPALLLSMRFSTIKARNDLDHLYQIVTLLDTPAPEGDVMAMAPARPAGRPWVRESVAWAVIGMGITFLAFELLMGVLM